MGWPREIPDPLTLTRAYSSGPMPISIRSARTWAAKASCISISSMCLSDRPADSRALTAARGTVLYALFGSSPTDAHDLKTARGFFPSFAAKEAEVTTTAAAPSFSVDELPAVQTPPSTGLSRANADNVASPTRALVSIHDDRFPFALRDHYGHDFIRELSRLYCSTGFLMTVEGPLVALLTSEGMLLCRGLRPGHHRGEDAVAFLGL